MRLIASTVALLVVAASQALAQESSPQDFRDFCRAIQGRWVGDLTWVADFPGMGKRGEKVTAYADNKMTEDGNAMISRMYAGTGSSTWFLIYDAGAKQIKTTWVTSGGTTSQSSVQRIGDKWLEKGAGSNPDGTKTAFESTLTITNNGNTHTWAGPSWLDGKKLDEQHDVWRRVSDK